VGYSAGFLDSFFARSMLFDTWIKDTQDSDWKPYVINFADDINDAQVEVLQGDLNGSLQLVGSPASMILRGFIRRTSMSRRSPAISSTAPTGAS